MVRTGRTILVALAALAMLSGLAQANHIPADGSARTLHGLNLVEFVLVALWPVQVGIALMVFRDAGLRGMGHRNASLLLVGIPVIGHLFAVAYYAWTRSWDRRSGGAGRPLDDPGRGRRPTTNGGRA